MGGIGKTTLAQSIYKDPLIDEYFDILAWTTISQGYSVKEMVIGLLGSIGHASVELSTDKLEENLYKSLKGMRYLIVMDDIWDINAWDYVNSLFPDENNGSRIILTTRLSEVATYVDPLSHIHHMRFLSMKGSWNLLLEKVFGGKCYPPKLEKFGGYYYIVQKCKGLPLAIVVVGGILSKVEKTPKFWQYVAENISLAITESDDHFTEILSLSYYHLPQHLKACFLYMGVFLEDQEISVSLLIKLWVAEGFIKPVGDKSLEEVAKENLKDLVDRCLILVRRLSYDREIKTCSIHDLLRDLCIKKAEEEKFLAVFKNNSWLHPEGRECLNNQRRVSFQLEFYDYPKDVTNSTIRSLLHFGPSLSLNGFLSFTMSFKLLRVLNALPVVFEEFPIQLLELINLRFLAFCCEKGKVCPSISKLCNLQTLLVYERQLAHPEFLYLPSVIWEMSQLRHIVFEKCNLRYPSGSRIDETNYVPLENLQTLANVYNFRFTSRLMPNLKKLVISYVYDSNTNWLSYDFSNFVH